jgi:hypothetical protein
VTVQFLEVLAIAFALSLDAFAVSFAASTAGFAKDRRAVFRLSFHFGLFQFLMPIVGYALGVAIEPIIAAFDHWIAFVLLTGHPHGPGVPAPEAETSRMIPAAASRWPCWRSRPASPWRWAEHMALGTRSGIPPT